MNAEPRIVCRFSCGAASAVATKLALLHYPHDRVHITYSDTNSEHPDNKRFMADCIRWFNHPITTLKSKKFKDTWDVWERERFIASRFGAPCTGALKRDPYYEWDQPTDILVMGYTAGEENRAKRIRETNFETHNFNTADRSKTNESRLPGDDRVSRYCFACDVPARV